MFIWLRRVFSEFVSITYWKTSLSPTRRQAASVSSCQFPRFFTAIFSCILLKEKLPSAAFFIGFCLAIVGIYLLSFSGGTNGGQSKRRFVGHICRCRLGFVFNPYERNRKVRLSDNIRHTKDFRIRNPLYAPSTIIRVMSELAKDF